MTVTYRIFWWRDRQAPHASEYSVIRSCPGRPDETVSTHPTIAEAKAAIPSPGGEQAMKPATVAEAHREGMRRAMEVYLSAGKLFDEPKLQEVYLISLARELRRLVRGEDR